MIPIAKPSVGCEEMAAAQKVIASGWLTQGPMVKEFEEEFASFVGAPHGCAVSSCTTALHLALLVVGVAPGDVVITVSHSFIATANAIRHCFAEPVFVDVNFDTCNMSAVALERCMSEECELLRGVLYLRRPETLAVGESPLRTLISRRERIGRIAAIVAVHQLGMPCDLSSILPLAQRYGIPVIEDAACAVGSEISLANCWEKIGKPHGDIACFSFHPRKILSTGDGGMLTTANPHYDAKFRLLRQHGMSIPDTVRHTSTRIIFESYGTTGFNYRLTDIQAAIGIEQLKKLPAFLTERRRLATLYVQNLAHISWLAFPNEPSYGKTNWQSFPVKVKEGAPITRDRLMQKLLDRGIATRRGVMNAHQESPYASDRQLPESEKARDATIMLPLFNGMMDREIEEVTKGIIDA